MKRLFFISFLFFVSQVFAADYYADSSGSGTTCSVGSPCTLNYAVETKAGSGDTVYVNAGSYTLSDDLDVTVSQTITATDQGDKPVITKTSEGFFRISASDVTISYLVLDNGSRRGSYWYGIVRLDSGNSLTVDNCEIRDGWIGVELQSGHSHTISNSTIHNFGTSGQSPEAGNGHSIALLTGGGSSWSEKILIDNNTLYDTGGDGVQPGRTSSPQTKYLEISNNEIYNNEEDGIDLKFTDYVRIHGNTLRDADGNGIVSHNTANQYATNVEVYNNIIKNNGWSGIYNTGGSCSDWTIYNNLIYGNAQNITYDSYNTYGALVSGNNSVFYHNVLYNNGTNSGAKNHGGIRSSSTTVTIKNNILWNNTGGHGNIYNDSNPTINYNYSSPDSPGLDPDTQANRVGTVSDTDPGFTDEANGDFTLESGSVNIGAVVNLGSPYDVDYEGNNRGAGGSADAGAYEFEPVATIRGVSS